MWPFILHPVYTNNNLLVFSGNICTAHMSCLLKKKRLLKNLKSVTTVVMKKRNKCMPLTLTAFWAFKRCLNRFSGKREVGRQVNVAYY